MAGRPAALIDWKAVDRLLQAGCTGVQIAARFAIHADTLYRACQSEYKIDFAAYSQEKRAHGETLLLEQQFTIAMKGDKTMLIWLGKQRLNQKEKHDHTTNDKDISLDDARIALLAKLTAQRDAG